MLKKLAAILYLILLAALTTSITYAWNYTANTQPEVVSIGTWEFIPVWSPTVQYFINNKVKYNGKTYIAKRDSLGIVPTNKAYWRVL